MRAILVCVDFSDILAVTLPRNVRFFDTVLVVTTPEDKATQEVVAGVPGARCHCTSVFFDRGAVLNKGAAIEEGFDVLGRSGWIVVMDADIVIPAWPLLLTPGFLYSPLRRMMERPPNPLVIPPEEAWKQFPLHPQQAEFAGFYQAFHGSDPVLQSRPWYPTDWLHAGGCDSEFQAKWPKERKIRLPFEVLHIGPAGTNWLGRASPLLDGSIPEGAWEKIANLRSLIRRRGRGPDRFRHEKLHPD